MEAPAHVLIVESDPDTRGFLAEALTARGCQVAMAATGQEALAAAGRADVVLFDLVLPDMDGLRLLERLRQDHPACLPVVLAQAPAVHDVVRVMRMGAEDVLVKPLEDAEAVDKVLHRIVGMPTRARIRSRVAGVAAEVGLVLGINPQMWSVAQVAHQVASTRVTVLIQGETGSGKEVLARFIHRASDRAQQPFIAVNCGALPEDLLESELFGHERGAFTGASTSRRGIFEIADRGTLFLDEIGEATHSVQVKLLRLLETGQFRRVGGEHEIKTNVRIVAATNVPLEDAVRTGRFRADLFYRLDVVTLHLPPLRERPEDIPMLVDHFVRRAAGGRPAEVLPETLAALCSYSWPGNVRELNNAITRAVALTGGGPIGPQHLPARIRQETGSLTAAAPGAPAPGGILAALATGADLPGPEALLEAWCQGFLRRGDLAAGLDLQALLDRWEEAAHHLARRVIHRVLTLTDHDREEAARRLNISLRTLRYLLNEKGRSR